MIARAMEAMLPEQRLTRITVELMRPIPMTGFRVQAAMRKPGRMVSLTEAELFDEDAVYARASGVHMRTVDDLDVPSGPTTGPDFSAAVEGPFPIDELSHNLPAFDSSVECRYDPAGGHGAGGPTTMWMRTKVPLLEDDEPSPFQKICPLADCANGISRNADIDDAVFINPDLTVSLHRDPVGEWFCAQAVSFWNPAGVGVADAALFDSSGPVGRATQSLLIYEGGG